MSRPTGGKKYFEAIGRRECAIGLPITYRREQNMWLPTWAQRERSAGFWQQSTVGFSQNMKRTLGKTQSEAGNHE